MTSHSLHPFRALRLSRRPTGGFTIVEIVVAFVIIAILTAVLVPTISRRSEDARLSAANSDMEHLANAFERVALDIGPIVRMYALDDVTQGNNVANYSIGNGPNGLDPIDGFSDEMLLPATPGDDIYLNPQKLFIDVTTQNFYGNDNQQRALFAKLVPQTSGETETNYNVINKWNGPYVQWSRDSNRNDWPDDPWGHDYLFFTREGMLSPPDRFNTDQQFRVDRSDQFYLRSPDDKYQADHIFDRFTILSLGPNGLPGDGGTSLFEYGTFDDLIRQFGGN